jgi:hypothetical protein
MRRLKPVIVGAHPSLYQKMEELRKMYQDQAGIRLSQMQLTNIISQRIRMPLKIDLIGGSNVKKSNKKIRPY